MKKKRHATKAAPVKREAGHAKKIKVQVHSVENGDRAEYEGDSPAEVLAALKKHKLLADHVDVPDLQTGISILRKQGLTVEIVHGSELAEAQ